MQQLNQPAVMRDTHTHTHSRTDALNMQILHMTAYIFVHKHTFLIRTHTHTSAQLLLTQTWRLSSGLAVVGLSLLQLCVDCWEDTPGTFVLSLKTSGLQLPRTCLNTHQKLIDTLCLPHLGFFLGGGELARTRGSAIPRNTPNTLGQN